MPFHPHVRALCALATIAVAACGGGGGDGGAGLPSQPGTPSTPARTAVALTPSASTLQPLQAATVRFPSNAGAAGTSLAATLGTNAFQIVLTDSSTGTFLAPDVAAGSYTLTVDFGTSFRGTATLTMAAAPVIADAKTEVTSSVTPVVSTIDSLVAALQAAPLDTSNVTPDEVAELKAKNAAFKAALASATPAELRQMALWLRANPGVLGASTAAAGAAAVSSRASLTTADISAAVNSYINDYTQKVVAAGITIGACVAGIPGLGIVTGGVAVPLITAACGVLIGWQATGIADMVTKRLWSLHVIADQLYIDLASTSSAAALAPGASAPGWQAAAVAVDPGVTTRLAASVRLRTIGPSDRGIVGGVFAAWDRAVALFTPLFSAVPSLRNYNFGPTSLTRYSTASASGSDITVSVPGCTAAPDGDGVQVTCSQVNTSDVTITANFTYRNAYSSASASVPITVRRTWASVGAPVIAQLRVYPVSILGDGTQMRACNFDMTIPVQGNTPVTFTRWDGVWVAGWPNNHVEGADVNFTLDPRKYDGVKWWNNQLVTGILPQFSNGSFDVNYTVQYKIPATGQTGTAYAVARCP